MTTTLYVPGTSETDTSKIIMSQQLVAGKTATNTDNIATNTTNIATNTSAITTLQTAGQGLTNVAGSLAVSLSKLTNSLSGDVSLNNTSNYFDGPSVAQGTTGTWFVSGTVTLTDPTLATMRAKLWDGTTVIASGNATCPAATTVVIALSGYLASPAGNLRISVRDTLNTTGKILFNQSANSMDSTISAIRIA